MNFEVGPKSKQMTNDQAFLYCLTLNHNGYKDWRMPTIMEYSSSSAFRGCWHQNDIYFSDTHWNTVPVRDVS